ncbi:MAG: hypothetical protein MI921_17885 [Cytophagales bacterium]|nr:hypothetical protein [Cytophagales bacterium]
MKINKIIVWTFAALILGIVYITFNQPGDERFSTRFKEITFLRNENNTGPINRIYAIYVQDSVWQDIESYAATKPYTKYGSTKVYFFMEDYPGESFLSWQKPNVLPSRQKACIAFYHKENNGRVTFRKYPFNGARN